MIQKRRTKNEKQSGNETTKKRVGTVYSSYKGRTGHKTKQTQKEQNRKEKRVVI
ncbi:hypothetical protein CPC08DRAFT_707878 [Agrocybe pediades]|nr:hypothetical protein CPC08DRAFT_707878 [Agrocybe pediades]